MRLAAFVAIVVLALPAAAGAKEGPTRGRVCGAAGCVPAGPGTYWQPAPASLVDALRPYVQRLGLKS